MRGKTAGAAGEPAFKAMGIDLSTKATGVVVLEGAAHATPNLILEEEIKADGEGMERARKIVLRIMNLIHEHKPNRIVLEGYSLSLQKPSSIVPLVELGGLLRFMLMLDGFTWYDPRASELKKFVSGKGNVGKEVVMMWVLKRWGHTSLTNNTADAFGLACMGLAHAGRLVGCTKDMVSTVGKMAEQSC